MQVEFISLSNALEGIAACISVHECTICPEEKKFSSAAGLLHQLLNNAPEERPRWVEINSITARPVFSDAALYPEGMEILLHTAGWHERERENHVKHLLHLAAAKERGIDPSLITKGHNLNDGRYPRLQLLRPRGIGFDRAELVAFLNNHQIEHDLLPQAGEANAEIKADSASNAPKAAVPEVENQQQRQARRWELCIKAGLAMPTDTYAQLPRGIGLIAKAEGITRQGFSQDLEAYRERLFGN